MKNQRYLQVKENCNILLLDRRENINSEFKHTHCSDFKCWGAEENGVSLSFGVVPFLDPSLLYSSGSSAQDNYRVAITAAVPVARCWFSACKNVDSREIWQCELTFSLILSSGKTEVQCVVRKKKYWVEVLSLEFWLLF